MCLLFTVTTVNLILHRNKAMFKATELILAGYLLDLWTYFRNPNLERREETRCCKTYKAHGN